MRKDGKTKNQGDRFIEAARELGCDEDEGAFKAKLKKLTSARSPASVGKRKTKKQGNQAAVLRTLEIVASEIETA